MSDWFNEFFFEAWPRIQSGGYTDERTQAECDLIVRALALQPGASVLDVPCGIGRHSVELAKRGFVVTGVDFNPEFVVAARIAAEAAGVAHSAEFVVADMRTFVAKKPADAVLCFFTSFGYFEEEGNRAFLRTALTSLRDGGRLLMDTHIQETLLPIFRPRDWNWAGPESARFRVLEERTFRPEIGVVDVIWTIVDDSGPSSHQTSLRIYAYREIVELLKSEGFSGVRVLDGKTGEPFQMGAPRALIVAEKPS